MASISAGAGTTRRKTLNPSLALVAFLDLLVCCVMFLLVTAVWNDLGRVRVSQRTPGARATGEPDPPRIAHFLAVRATGYELGSTAGERRWIARDDARELHAGLVALRGLEGTERHALTLSADDGVSYQELVGAMDAALGAGFDTLDVSDDH